MNHAIRSRPLNINVPKLWRGLISNRNRAFSFMIVGALLAFEIFNYSTTEFALNDVLGNLTFLGIKWATILAIAFCGIDFAGIARIFTPEQGMDEPAEVWYLFGAWVLAAAMNATLTWWGVSVAIVDHTSQGSAVLGNGTIRTVVPIFVAVMVWVIRILVIGTFSVAADKMFNGADARPRRSLVSTTNNRPARPVASNGVTGNGRPILAPASSFRAAPKPAPRPEASSYNRGEPTYHNLMSARSSEYDERG